MSFAHGAICLDYPMAVGLVIGIVALTLTIAARRR